MLRALLLLLLLLASPVVAGRSDSLGFTYDAAGNVTAEARTGGGTYGYSYNAAGRMEAFSINDFLQASYKYDAMGRQAIRTLTSPSPVTIHSVFDSEGRRIAEYDETSGALLREYIWNGWEPVAVIEGGVVSFVRADHIGRPVFATNSSGVKVWSATYLPFGGVHVATGAPPTARFPGQWFQSESGLHQNWMRDYDPTTGRYLEPDPLGLVDGASVYGYVKQNPGRWIDPWGLLVDEPWSPPGAPTTNPSPAPAPKPSPAPGPSPGSLLPKIGGKLIGGAIAGILVPDTLGDGTQDHAYKQMEEECQDWDCRKASNSEVNRIVESAGEKDAHSYKTGYGAVPNSLWDICICKTGNVVLRRTGMCGKGGPTIPTWEVN